MEQVLKKAFDQQSLQTKAPDVRWLSGLEDNGHRAHSLLKIVTPICQIHSRTSPQYLRINCKFPGPQIAGEEMT